MNTRGNKAGIFTLLAAGALISTAVAAVPSAHAAVAAARPVVLRSSAAPRIPAGATRLGVVPASQRVHLDIALKVRDQAGLTAFLDGLANRKSRYFHHFLARGQFGPRFGATLAQVSAVQSALTSAGLAPGPVTANRLAIPVTATAAQVERAFGVSLVSYRLPGGRVAFANATAPAIPASIAPVIDGVLGLNDLYQAHPAGAVRAPAGTRARRLPSGPSAPAGPATRRVASRTAQPAATGPQPCATASATWANTADVFAGYYGTSQLYALGDLGQGQRVAVMEFEPNLPSDISAYEACYGISTPVNYLEVDGGTGSSGAGSGEAALDIEVLAGLAPDSTIDVYQAPNTISGGMYDTLSQFVTSDTESAMSISWGLCEAESAAADLNAQENLAAQGEAQGQTILAAAGDAGSTDCFTPADSSNALSIDMPAGNPYIVSVGGTGFDSAGNEVTWNESGLQEGAGGGGLSGYWCMPDYQYQPAIPGMFDGEQATYSSCVDSVDTQGYVREAPDVAADADPESGYLIYLNGAWQGGWGGTSAATPLWASIAALTSASPYCSAYGSGWTGVLPETLYTAVAGDQAPIYGGSYPQVIRDITSGNNDYTPSGYAGGLYAATTGYDLATGLGAPIVAGVDSAGSASTYYPGYTALACQQMATRSTSSSVTGVSPGAGSAGHAATVTVHGTGFLPIAGADRVREYSGSTLLATLTPSCTTTACTMTVPAEPAGTVDLLVSAEDGAYTSPAAADRYTYASPPHITSISPAHGTRLGGTTVTIRGTSFIGVTSVTFGTRAGTHIAVSATGTLTVVAPAGPEGSRVSVVVRAAGGASNAVSYLYADIPHITSIAPAQGTHLGGTKVTLKGTNFAGVKSVTFAGRAGTRITVTGTTTLTVYTPAGTRGARVKVVITGAAGVSNAVLYLYT